jgi:RNA polymerase sigma-70 factor (ECF subfamily)
MAGELDFDEFYDASFRRVVGQVFAMAGSLSEAEDSVQEAFARAWQNWSRVSGYTDPEGWVRSVAFKISVSSWRKAVNRFTAHRRQAAERAEPPGVSPDQLAVIAALRRIPPDLRQVVVLHHLLDRSVAEISREIGVPSGTVKARLVRGRKAMAPYLSESAEAAVGAVGPGSAKDENRRSVAGVTGEDAREEGANHV